MDLKKFATETRNPDSQEACKNIDEANGNAKLAITKILTGTNLETAGSLLEQAKDHVRVAIQLAQEKE